MSRLSFCCNRRCFVVPDSQVDGRACRVCDCYCYCRCRCRSLWPRSYTVSRVQLLPERRMYEFVKRYVVADAVEDAAADRFYFEHRFHASTLLDDLRDDFAWSRDTDDQLSVTFVGRVSVYEKQLNVVWRQYKQAGSSRF